MLKLLQNKPVRPVVFSKNLFLTLFLITVSSQAAEKTEISCKSSEKSEAITEEQKNKIVQVLEEPFQEVLEILGENRVVHAKLTVVKAASSKTSEEQTSQLFIGEVPIVLKRSLQKPQIFTGRSCECPEGCPCDHCSGKKGARCNCKQQKRRSSN